MVAKAINLVMRAFEFIWAILIMSLVGNMIETAFHGNTSIVNYDMFVAVFSMVTLFYAIPATINENLSGHPIILIVLDGLNCVIYFCGAVSMAAYLHVHSCGNHAYTSTNKVTNGSHNSKKRCKEAQATTAFLWFGFACYLVSAVLSSVQGKNSGSMRGGMGGIRRGPAMSQV